MKKLKHKFVDLIPDSIEDNTLYISIEYCTAMHNCMCGCGNEVVTPFSPTDWELIFDGNSISLFPSIGNWNFDCRSHYWIHKNNIKWAERWSNETIEFNRYEQKKIKSEYYDENRNVTLEDVVEKPVSKTKKIWIFIKSIFNIRII